MSYESLPYFHARLCSIWGPSRTIHRVYITEADLLFVHLDISTLTPEETAKQGAPANGGGLIIALIAYCMTAMGRHRLDRITKSLDVADEEILREFIEGDDKSFIIPLEEIQDVRIEQKTVWSSLLCGDLLAFLYLNCASRGPMWLGLIAPHEMPLVAEQMQRLFGDLHCESWRMF